MTRGQLTTVFVLLTVIFLGLSALLAPPMGAAEEPPKALLPFRPSEVSSVVLTGHEEGEQRLVRVGADRWEVQLVDGSGGASVRWPIETGRVRAFLRIMDRMRGVPGEAPDSAPATRLRVETGDGRWVAIGLPGGTLGGRSVVTLESADEGLYGAFVTSDELPRLMGGRGFLGWLDARAFAGVSGRVKRVEIASGRSSLVLTSSEGRWRIESPFATAAETALVEELVQGLQLLPIGEARAEPSEPAADATTLILTTESREALSDGSVATNEMVHRCVTLGPVSAGGRVPVLLSASAGSDAGNGLAGLVSGDAPAAVFGPVTASVDAARLTELVRQPAFYIARRSLRAEPGDVRSLRITPRSGVEMRVERDGAGWLRDGVAVGPNEAAAIESLVEIVTLGEAVVAAWAASPAADVGGETLATIECEGLGGVGLETLRFGVGALPAPAEDTRLHAVLSVGEVLRFYPPDAGVGAAATWIAGLGKDAGTGATGP